jgi:hypothetical protein
MSPEKFQPEIEQSPERGNNITLNFVFARHGEKSGEGEESILTEKGREQATELGHLIETPKDGVKIYYSDKTRAQQTAEILMNEIEVPQTQTEKVEELKEKGFKSARIHRQEKLLGTEILDEELVKTQFGGSAKFIEMNEETIPQNVTSPRELASAVAKHIIRFVNASSRLPSNVEGTLINITHLPTLLSFLKNTIGENINQNPINSKGGNFVEKTGGPINPAEQIRLKVHRNNPESFEITIQLRDREFSIDPETLKSLATYQRVKIKQ